MLIVVNGPSAESARARFKMVLAGHLPLLPIGENAAAIVASSFIRPGASSGALWSPLADEKTRITVSSTDPAIAVELSDVAADHQLTTGEYVCKSCTQTILAADSDSLDGKTPNMQLKTCPACGEHNLKSISTFNALSLVAASSPEKGTTDGISKTAKDGSEVSEQAVGTITASEEVSNDSTDRRTAKMKRNKQVLAGDDEATKLGTDENDPVTIEDLDGGDAENPELAEDDLDNLGEDDENDENDEDDGEDPGFDLDATDSDDAEDGDNDDVPEVEEDLDDNEVQDDDAGDGAGEDESSDDNATIVPEAEDLDETPMGEVSSAKTKGKNQTRASETKGGAPVKQKVTTANALVAGKRLRIETPNVLIVSRPSLAKAALAASKFSTKTALAHSTVASSVKNFLNTAGPNQKLRFDVHGLLAGECPLCSYHTIASNSMAPKNIKCQNCGSGIPTLIPAALSADPSELEDSVDIDMPNPEDCDDDQNAEEESAIMPAGNSIEPDDGGESEEDAPAPDLDDLDEESGDDEDDGAAPELEDVDGLENDGDVDVDVPTDESAPPADTEDEIDGNIEEIDMAQACAIEASDTVELHYCVNASAKAGTQWMLTVNSLPIMTLSRSAVKGDFAKLANEHFNNSQFASKVMAAVLTNKTRAIEAAASIGFVGVKVPAIVDKVVTAKTREHRYQVEAAAAQRVQNYQKAFINVLPVAATGINRGFFAGKTNPMKTALCTALQKAGVQGAAKIVHKVFSEHASAFNSLLIDRAQYLLSKSPETRRELASAIMGPSYTFAEDNQEGTDPNQDQGDNVDPGDVTKIDDPNQDQDAADEHEDSVESDATVDHAGLDKMLQSADQNGVDNAALANDDPQQTIAAADDTVTRTRSLLRGFRSR